MAKRVKRPRLKPQWEPLQPGDIVDIVAPASSSSAKDFHNALRFVKKFGLVPRAPKNIFGRDILCANTDEMRFKHLKKALMVRDSKAVWCLRGGYGSLRLMPQMLKLKAPSQCKLFIGYSDITGVHNFLNQKWNWPTLHGSMLEELGRGEGGRGELLDFFNVLYGFTKEVKFGHLHPMNPPARVKKTIKAPIVGGNLAILGATLGTSFQVEAKGKILMLEDIGERGYRVDRMLVQMEQAGVFKGVRAVIFGDFVGGEENKDEDCIYLWKDVQNRFAKENKFPVLKDMPFGHGAFQRPVPFNTKADLIMGRKARLNIRVR